MGLAVCLDHADTIYRDCESEGHDRESVLLPGMMKSKNMRHTKIGVQEELLKRLRAKAKVLITVFINGGPVSSKFAATESDAFVEAWY